jgi:hypothetical protein
MDSTMHASLVKNALRMAIVHRQPQAGLLHHSDRGSQYAGLTYQSLLSEQQMVVSMSRTGDCYDSAAMESFFGTLKCELVHDRHYCTRDEAQQDIFEFIKVSAIVSVCTRHWATGAWWSMSSYANSVLTNPPLKGGKSTWRGLVRAR